MSDAEPLDEIASEMEVILRRFFLSKGGWQLHQGDDAKFTGLVLEARSEMKAALGLASDFDFQIEQTRIAGRQGFFDTQSKHSVEQCIGIVRSAANTVRRKKPAAPLPTLGLTPPYVSYDRIGELRAASNTTWDLRRLVRMCEEINSAFAAGNYISVGMLLRAITDHVPPIFGAPSFKAYISQITGRSHRGSMDNLQSSLRNIADGFLHEQIRAKEVLPAQSRVDFRQDLDVLLGEVVRELR